MKTASGLRNPNCCPAATHTAKIAVKQFCGFRKPPKPTWKRYSKVAVQSLPRSATSLCTTKRVELAVYHRRFAVEISGSAVVRVNQALDFRTNPSANQNPFRTLTKGPRRSYRAKSPTILIGRPHRGIRPVRL